MASEDINGIAETMFMQDSPTANSLTNTSPPAQLTQRSASDGVGINNAARSQLLTEDANRQCTSDVVWRKRFNNKVSPTRHVTHKGQPRHVAANSSSGTTERSNPDVANRSPSAIVLQDVDVVDGFFPTHQRPKSRSSKYIMELQELPSLQQSCKPLKERLKLRRQALEYHGDDSQQTGRTRAAKRIWCETLRFIKWPKWRSEIRNKFSFHPWKGHINHVESHFGSFVASYFVFLRWLLYMNIIIAFLWCGFTCIPMLVIYGFQGLDPANKAAACVYAKPETNNLIRCSSNTSYTVLVYEIKNSNIYNCSDDFFNIRECLIDNDGVAYKEGSSELTVSAVKIYDNCTQNSGSSGLATYVLCSQVKSRFEWYEYILDFVTGAGYFNETLLFHGGYPPASSSHFVLAYRFDLAFLFIVGIVFVFSIIHLVYKLGSTYNESYTALIKGGRINFSNRLFSSWDFNINDTKASNRRKANIKTDFQEEYGDAQARARETTWKKYLLVIFIRILSNTVVIVLLVIAGAAIYYSADTEFDLLTKSTVRDNIILSTLVGFITSTVISVLNVVYPWLFYFIAMIELYPTENRRVSWTLVRTIFVRLSSLLVLLGSLYRVISNCTTAVDESSSGDSCTLTKITHTILTNNTDDTQIECPVCWETYIGQQFYKLALFNFVFALGATASSETARNILFHLVKRIRNENYRKKLSKIPLFQRGHFDIPRSILDLIYTQTLLWLGFLFSPWIPLIILPTTFLLFYVKKYSLMFNLDPDRKSLSKSARSNFIFLILMLCSLFISIIPVLFAVTQLKPSENCGPFRGLNTMYDSATNLAETWPCGVQVAVDFLTSAAFVVPLITFFLLALYGMWVALKTQRQKYKFMKKSILAANVNGTADMADVFGNLGIMRRHYTRN